MNKLKIGYASTLVNPPLGYPLHGYYLDRYGKGFIDDLEASALAINCDDKTAIVISVDNGGFQQNVIAKFLLIFSNATTKLSFISSCNLSMISINSSYDDLMIESKFLNAKDNIFEAFSPMCRIPKPNISLYK